ncbi:MAG: ABC transporter substrate binding protein, partial [Pseudolabrys sp.]|jgi:putative ABC transport system substrate-binding protein
VRRREFIRLLGGTAAWPLVANAQDQRVRRIGILTALDETENKVRIDPLLQELPRLGWTEGRNVRTDMRAAGGNADVLRKYATELVALTPDVLVAFGSAPTDHLLQSTRTAPIVFTIITDPLGSGFVNNLARPSGNATGFMLFEYSLSGKWLDLLMQIAPDIKRVAVMPAPAQPSGARRYGTKVRQRGHFV